MESIDDIEHQLRMAEARSKLSALDDDTLVSEELGSIFLHVSQKVMKNLRTEEDGPEFFKPIAEGAKKANQAVSYTMGSLRRWKQKHTYKNNLDVAVRTGITAWVVEPRPFFVKDEHRGMFSVLAPADDVFDDDWGDRLATAIEGGDVQVEWIVPAEAAAIRWSDLATHQRFSNGYLEAMDAERRRVAVALGATDLASDI
jgi:hypothetical protein